MFEDECGGRTIETVWGVRAELCAFEMFDGEETKKCKGVQKYVVQKKTKFENCFFSGRKQLRKMNVICSDDHQICREKVNKVTLSAIDDKRIIP